MNKEQMTAMAHAMREAWEMVATEHPEISWLFEDDAPYLTIWDHRMTTAANARTGGF